MKHSGPTGASFILPRQGSQRGRALAALPLFLVAFFLLQFASVAQVSNIYSTGFELSEDFDFRDTLIGRGCTPAGKQCWTGTDTHANRIVTNYFFPEEQFGQQQASIGRFVLTNETGTLNVWRPLNFDPVASALPIVTFSVTMSIYDSFTVTNRDSFRWSVYNTNNSGERLFSIDFDNTTTQINYVLDDGEFPWTGYFFDNADQDGGDYDLVVIMNFADNLWSAWLNDFQIVDSEQMTTTGSALNLGDIDAVWVNDTLGKPGDNFMVFDNYAVTAEPYPFRLDPVGRLSNGTFFLRLTGEPERRYAIEVSEDLRSWFLLNTKTVDADGTVIVDDPAASDYDHSFYRARLIMP
jgi:hypothetical protein